MRLGNKNYLKNKNRFYLQFSVQIFIFSFNSACIVPLYH